MFVTLVVIVLFLLPYLLNEPAFAKLLPISITSAGLAAVTLAASLALYFVAPRHNLPISTFIIYSMLAVTISSIVVTTGDSGSPFIGLWIGVAVFAGIFSWQGFTLIALLALSYGFYMSTQQEPFSAVVVAAITTIAPLIVSYIIWHSKSTKDLKHDKAYRELATELSQESSKSDAVINAINDGVIAVDKEGVIQLINPSATRIIGWGQSDAVGLSYLSVIKLRDKLDKPISSENDPIAQVFTTSQEVHSEDFSLLTEAGKKMLLSVVVSPLGHPATGAIMVFRDMTKEKAEEREQAEFISTASHEMRTPVASIEGYLGLALNPATATIDEKAREYIKKAQSSAQHLGRLFQDLLDVSKTEDGRVSNFPKVIDVTKFVAEIIEGLAPKAAEKGLGFIYKPTIEGTSLGDRKIMPVYYVHVDSDHMREIVSNLVENAIKYTLTGDVIINVTGDEGHVSISIQDSGIGIPAEDIPHLFQKFYRVDNSDTREIGGTGLGLYLCRRLAEVMGGRMHVESQYKKGSTFSLILPRLDNTKANQMLETAAAEAADEQSSQSLQQSVQAAAVTTPVPTVQQPTTTQVPQPLQQPAIDNVVHQTMSATPQTPTPAVETPALSPPPITAPQPAPFPQAARAPVAASTLSATSPRPGQDILPTRPVTPQAPNIPLSELEKNPSAYVAQRTGIQIPNRNNTGN